MSKVFEVLKERSLAKDANKKIVEEALDLLKELHSSRATINTLMNMDEAKFIIQEAVQALSEL